MAQTLKALSALLAYPTEALQAAVPELRAAIADEGIVAGDARRLLVRLIDEIATGDLYDLQERYILLFDRTRSLSLHLFEHVHGESRDRGQAMIDLANLYAANGLAIDAAELPDYLPLFLEFLSTRPLAEARGHLGEAGHILETLAERLARRQSPYAPVFAALVAIAGAGAARDMLPPVEDTDPDDLAALDAAWEDAPVTFGPEAAPGCKDDLIARLRAAKRPATASDGSGPDRTAAIRNPAR